MPSFIVHSIVGREISKRLKLTGDKKEEFFIANLLPDTKQVERQEEWSEVELRLHIQKEKRVTHFRTNMTSILEYPDVDYFLTKYHKEVENNLVAFGYFFHLYTDYYYFNNFLPKILTFLDKNLNETKMKDYSYVKINKTGKILNKTDFWSKKGTDGIYSDYSRLNKYLIDKYEFKYRCNDYKKYLDSGKFIVPIDEIKYEKIYDLLDELNDFYIESKNSELEDFKIFDSKDIDKLIEEIVTSFINKYEYFIK